MAGVLQTAFQIHILEWKFFIFKTSLKCTSNSSIGLDNGLLPVRSQAIIWTNTGIWSIVPLGTNFSENFNRDSNIFIEADAFQNVICHMAAIFSRPQGVKGVIDDNISMA